MQYKVTDTDQVEAVTFFTTHKAWCLPSNLVLIVFALT